MDGRVILGDQIEDEPAYLFFHRDRMDEVYELQRAARDRRWKYIRNFEPSLPYSQRLDYMDEMPMMQDWRRLAAADRLVGGQKNWFQVPKPIEELYDTQNDPWELENLAELPQYADRLARMRNATETWQQTIGDTGMIPEAVLMEEMKPGGETPRVQPPEISVSAGSVFLRSRTEGVGFVYRVKQADRWTDWMLYSRAFPDPDADIEAIAFRAGLGDSQPAV